MRTVKRLRVNIPAGVRDGSRIRLAGKGEPGRAAGPPGDLYLITHVSPSPVFTRKGDNLEVEVPLSIPEALRGAEVQVPTLERHQDAARASRHRARHRPAPARRGTAEARRLRARARGDIHYRFVIDVPEKLSKEQEKAVEAALQDARRATRARGLFRNGRRQPAILRAPTRRRARRRRVSSDGRAPQARLPPRPRRTGAAAQLSGGCRWRPTAACS